MGFLSDWAAFPDKKKDLLTLADKIKRNASNIEDYQLMYTSDLGLMLSEMGLEFVGTNDDKIVSAIRSALLELSDAVIKNKYYAEILVADGNAVDYIALCMLVFKNSSNLSKLNDVIKRLNLNIPIKDVIDVQEGWYILHERDMLRAAAALKEAHNKE